MPTEKDHTRDEHRERALRIGHHGTIELLAHTQAQLDARCADFAGLPPGTKSEDYDAALEAVGGVARLLVEATEKVRAMMAEDPAARCPTCGDS